MTRIMHVSDTHGKFPPLNGDYSIVVHSGDFFPDFHGKRPNAAQGEHYDWLVSKTLVMKQWLKGHPFLFCLGNHDALNADMMENFLNSEGIKAINLHDRISSFDNINFYGFPYVPAINGNYNYEALEKEMTEQVDRMVEAINKTYTDVIVAHAPIYGTLDEYHGRHIGNVSMANALDYKIEKDMMPHVFMCGHLHETCAITMRGELLVSNMATSQCIIEV